MTQVEQDADLLELVLVESSTCGCIVLFMTAVDRTVVVDVVVVSLAAVAEQQFVKIEQHCYPDN